jgi:hypothetical protein
VNPYERIAALMTRCPEHDTVLPPTALFNEGWMLRLVLDWAESHRDAIPELQFNDDSKWFSEALLPSRFRPRKRGDTGGEGFTHADGVIGHFKVRDKRGDIELLPGACQLTVIEAKMASGLSAGTKYAPQFNQAARNVACIAHLVAGAKIDPASIHLGFVVIAPQQRIDEGAFAAVTRESICEAVTKRARAYEDLAVAWCEDQFKPVAERCSIDVLSWETVLDHIAAVDADTGREFTEFYKQCVRYNPMRPARA